MEKSTQAVWYVRCIEAVIFPFNSHGHSIVKSLNIVYFSYFKDSRRVVISRVVIDSLFVVVVNIGMPFVNHTIQRACRFHSREGCSSSIESLGTSIRKLYPKHSRSFADRQYLRNLERSALVFAVYQRHLNRKMLKEFFVGAWASRSIQSV